jgi:hypothetical protein
MQMPNTTSLPPKVGHILRLAEIIREVDGNHDKGAAALAEAVLSHPQIGMVLAAEQQWPPPKPIPTEELRAAWNQQADEFNQWESLDLGEQLAWAQARALDRFGGQP